MVGRGTVVRERRHRLQCHPGVVILVRATRSVPEPDVGRPGALRMVPLTLRESPRNQPRVGAPRRSRK